MNVHTTLHTLLTTPPQYPNHRILGPKKQLWVATYPVEAREATARVLEALFDIPCQTLPNFLNLTLTPSNQVGALALLPLAAPRHYIPLLTPPIPPHPSQIIHPARYYGIFKDWDGHRTYSKQELEARDGLTLYKGMDEFSAEWLAVLDNELQQIKVRKARLGCVRGIVWVGWGLWHAPV